MFQEDKSIYNRKYYFPKGDSGAKIFIHITPYFRKISKGEIETMMNYFNTEFTQHLQVSKSF